MQTKEMIVVDNLISPNIVLTDSINSLNQEVFFDENYLKYKNNIQQRLDDETYPFLTVLIRTQGRRESGLRECLLCLAAQDSLDFEVIIIGHKVDEDNQIVIKQIIDDQPHYLKSKIRYVDLAYGTRTVPLNMGFSLAKGQYISVYDDDDIVFENWVSTFKNASGDNMGKILHSFAYSQQWEVTTDGSYKAITKPDPFYFHKFDLLTQLIVNRCPFMTLAFPSDLFQKMGMTFDEQLNVTEDWEYFMRCALLTGVVDTGVPVTIYRLWTNTDTSATEHKENEWNQTLQRIHEKTAKNGLYFPPEESRVILKYLSDRVDKTAVTENRGRLYYSTKSEFINGQYVEAFSDCQYPNFNFWFSLKEIQNSIDALRIDLPINQMFVLKDLNIEVYDSAGDVTKIDFKKCACSGITYGRSVLFLHAYPVIVWSYDNDNNIECVHVSGNVQNFLESTPIQIRIIENLIDFKNILKKRILHRKKLF